MIHERDAVTLAERRKHSWNSHRISVATVGNLFTFNHLAYYSNSLPYFLLIFVKIFFRFVQLSIVYKSTFSARRFFEIKCKPVQYCHRRNDTRALIRLRPGVYTCEGSRLRFRFELNGSSFLSMTFTGLNFTGLLGINGITL